MGYQGGIRKLFEATVKSYDLGEYTSHEVIEVGYEDVNFRLTTTKASYFLKVFSTARSDASCERYIKVIRAVLKAGVNHPKLLLCADTALFRPQDTSLRLVVMEWLEDSSNFYQTALKDNDRKLLVEQAAKINSCTLTLQENEFEYDSWAVNNIQNEYNQWEHILNDNDKALLHPVLERFSSIDSSELPACFVHGDLIRTNIIRNKSGLYVYDFSVSNIYPRVQELAVLLSDTFFDPDSLSESTRLYHLLLSDYQQHTPLTKIERQALPIYAEAAHAMHVLGAARSNHIGEGGDETDMWWNLGRRGLTMDIYR